MGCQRLKIKRNQFPKMKIQEKCKDISVQPIGEKKTANE